MRHLLFILVLSLASQLLSGQELNVTVKISAPNLVTVDPTVFKALEQDLSNFYNNTKWTEDEFEDHEKIEASVNINIKEEISPTAFVGDFYVQAVRPIYKSNTKTQVFSFADNGVRFVYREFQPIQNSFNNYIDPLSSLLTFYSYLILAFDYDSFSPSGGDPYFQIAQNIISTLPLTVVEGTGWDGSTRDRLSRFNVVKEMLDPRARPYRQALYEYHVKSLDKMYEDAEKSRAVMSSALTAINQVHTSFLNSAIIQMFCDSKRKEIVEIYKGASRGDQTKVFEMMVKMDPARTSEYGKIK